MDIKLILMIKGSEYKKYIYTNIMYRYLVMIQWRLPPRLSPGAVIRDDPTNYLVSRKRLAISYYISFLIRLRIKAYDTET